jgi:hypothetical protein
MLAAVIQRPPNDANVPGATSRRFPPLWSVEDGGAYFVVRDHGGQGLASVHLRDDDFSEGI